MYENAATQANLATLRERGMIIVGPAEGRLASGRLGPGRLVDIDVLLGTLRRVLGQRGDLAGRKIVVSAGGTREPLDPVRFIGNYSSGKMGYAIAEAARDRGAMVTLVSAPVALAAPYGVELVAVKTAVEMRDAVVARCAGADVLIMAAAVADYRPAARSVAKLERGAAGARLALELVANPDLLAEIGAARTTPRPLLVGFALETSATEAMVERARAKLERKGLDLVVANRAEEALDQDASRVALVTRSEAIALDPMPKAQAADRILDWVAKSCPT